MCWSGRGYKRREIRSRGFNASLCVCVCGRRVQEVAGKAQNSLKAASGEVHVQAFKIFIFWRGRKSRGSSSDSSGTQCGLLSLPMVNKWQDEMIRTRDSGQRHPCWAGFPSPCLECGVGRGRSGVLPFECPIELFWTKSRKDF